MELAKNRIHQGDCVELLKQVEPGTVDLVFADPPFNIGYKYDVYDDAQQAEDYLAWCRSWISGAFEALKPTGTFWLAIGDEFAAELKIEAQKAGFQCRSWVIWYYTFGVNCANGFSRSHTHLFHFVKDPKKFTFNRPNPQIRVKSARQLVYADRRANPLGRLPDNTWIIRPQDAPQSFSPMHDTWYFARVAGTFKEREGFHGCQMPEQLLARIIRTSSHPQDLVLDPFGGSGTTLSVAKKLGRHWIGFELSPEYVKYINERLERTQVGDPIDGPEDPIQSAPATAQGKRRSKPFDATVRQAVIDAYQTAGEGYPVDYLLCHKELNAAFISACLAHGIGGNATVWNRYLQQLRKNGELPRSLKPGETISREDFCRHSMASEVAWRLLQIDYEKSLDEILCSPELAAEFDRMAREFDPADEPASSLTYRLAALSIRKRSKSAREKAAQSYGNWIGKTKPLPSYDLDGDLTPLEAAGVFVLQQQDIGFYVEASDNARKQLEEMLANSRWLALQPDRVAFVQSNESLTKKYALKSALVQRELAMLNCRSLIPGPENR